MGKQDPEDGPTNRVPYQSYREREVARQLAACVDQYDRSISCLQKCLLSSVTLAHCLGSDPQITQPATRTPNPRPATRATNPRVEIAALTYNEIYLKLFRRETVAVIFGQKFSSLS